MRGLTTRKAPIVGVVGVGVGGSPRNRESHQYSGIKYSVKSKWRHTIKTFSFVILFPNRDAYENINASCSDKRDF